MPVTLRTGSILKKLLGGSLEVQAQGTTISELLENVGIMDNICDSQGRIRRHFNIHVNGGEDVRMLQGLDTPVKDGDVVTVLSAIAGGDDTRSRVWLNYPADMVDKPLVWEAGQKFKVTTNIRQASVSKNMGLLGLEITGEEEEVQKALEFFETKGVTVEPVELDVVE